MSKLFRNIFVFILIIIFIIAFSSSYLSLSIDNLAYVLAIGIDTSDENNLEVTFQFSTTTSASESGSTEKATPVVNSVKASSLSNAINLMNSYMGKQINMSHCKVIIFSEEFAYQGISDEIYTLINDTQIRPSSNIIVSKCDAKYYIKQVKPELENLMSKYYEVLTNSSQYTGYIPDATIGDFFHGLICNQCQPYAILGGINQASGNISTNTPNSQQDSSIKANETPINGENGSENIGIAVFKEDVLVGELNAIETISFLAIKNDVDRFLISIPDPVKEGNYLDVYLTPYQSPNIKINTNTSSPYIHVKTKFSGRIYSMSKDSSYLTPEILDAISNSCNSYLESTFSSTLYKTSKEFHSDIFEFGENSLPTFLTTKELFNYNWLDNYKNAFFDVDVDTSIKSGMLITET